jgi:O-antigen/teichoic acid export membrane protein
MASMLASQAVQMPISFVTNAILARKLGPAEFGALYFGSTVVGLGFIFVDWGQTSAISLQVARDRSRTAGLVGTSVVLKLVFSVLAAAALTALGFLQGYSTLEWLAVVFYLLTSFAATLQATGTAVLRGLELTEQVSAVAVAGVFVTSALGIGIVLAGFGLRGVLWSILAGGLFSLIVTAELVRRQKIGAPRFSTAIVRVLAGQGTIFLAYNVVLAAQPYIDSAMLARLAPPAAMGWHAATRRITGLLLLPGISVGYSLYPTLVRLQKEAPERAVEMMRTALKRLVLLGMPATLGAILFAQPVVELIYGANYQGAARNLQAFAPWLVLVYFSIVIGNALFALERVMKWTAVQALCLVISAAFDAPLIHFFQDRFANGAIGISVSNIISEVLMVTLGAALLPRTMLSGGLARATAQALIAGGAMVATGLALNHLPAVIGAMASMIAYLITLFLVRGFTREDVRAAVALLSAKKTR